MSEKQTLSTWLRNRDVYQDVVAEESEPQTQQWRHALLEELEYSEIATTQKPAASEVYNSPLEFHHLLLMMPVGLVLFVFGWLFGSQTISMEKIAGTSPWVWVGSSIFVSVGYLFWRGRAISWRR